MITFRLNPVMDEQVVIKQTLLPQARDCGHNNKESNYLVRKFRAGSGTEVYEIFFTYESQYGAFAMRSKLPKYEPVRFVTSDREPINGAWRKTSDADGLSKFAVLGLVAAAYPDVTSKQLKIFSGGIEVR